MPSIAWLLLSLAPAAGAADPVFDTLLGAIDRDGDGTIDGAEYARVDELGSLADLDGDGDGRVSVDELSRWVRVTQPRPETRRTHRVSADALLAPGLRSVVVPGAAVAAPAASASGSTARLVAIGLAVGLVGLVGGVLLGRRRRR